MRFKKYVAKWNSALLEQVVSIYDGTHQTPTYTESGVKFVSVENIKDLYASNKYISYADFKENYKIVPQAGDILMTRIGDIGTPALVTTNEDLAYYVSLALLKVGKSITAKYLLQYIQTSFFKKELWEKTLHIAFPIKINKGDISLCKVQYPNISEQEEISHFLTLIDQRIDTQSKIIEELKTQMKGICNKIFYDIIGDDYTLNDILIEKNERTTITNQHPILSSTVKGLFLQREYFSKSIASEDNCGYKIVHLNELIISPQNLWLGNITYNERFDIGIVSPSYKVFEISPEFDKYYIACMLKTKQALHSYMCVSEQGASVVRRNLNMELFGQLTFTIPSYNKQKEIGCFLKKLDEKISLEQAYLNSLTKQKQYLLTNMFI